MAEELCRMIVWRFLHDSRCLFQNYCFDGQTDKCFAYRQRGCIKRRRWHRTIKFCSAILIAIHIRAITAMFIHSNLKKGHERMSHGLFGLYPLHYQEMCKDERFLVYKFAWAQVKIRQKCPLIGQSLWCYLLWCIWQLKSPLALKWEAWG